MSAEAVTPEPIPLDFIIHDPDEIKMITVGTPKGNLTVPADLEDWVGNSFDLIVAGRFREALMTTAGPIAEDIARATQDDEKKVAEAVQAAEDTASKLTIRQITGIIDHVASLAGVTPGESRGSATSSRSIETKSKRTSARSTPELA